MSTVYSDLAIVAGTVPWKIGVPPAGGSLITFDQSVPLAIVGYWFELESPFDDQTGIYEIIGIAGDNIGGSIVPANSIAITFIYGVQGNAPAYPFPDGDWHNIVEADGAFGSIVTNNFSSSTGSSLTSLSSLSSSSSTTSNSSSTSKSLSTASTQTSSTSSSKSESSSTSNTFSSLSDTPSSETSATSATSPSSNTNSSSSSTSSSSSSTSSSDSSLSSVSPSSLTSSSSSTSHYTSNSSMTSSGSSTSSSATSPTSATSENTNSSLSDLSLSSGSTSTNSSASESSFSDSSNSDNSSSSESISTNSSDSTSSESETSNSSDTTSSESSQSESSETSEGYKSSSSSSSSTSSSSDSSISSQSTSTSSAIYSESVSSSSFADWDPNCAPANQQFIQDPINTYTRIIDRMVRAALDSTVANALGMNLQTWQITGKGKRVIAQDDLSQWWFLGNRLPFVQIFADGESFDQFTRDGGDNTIRLRVIIHYGPGCPGVQESMVRDAARKILAVFRSEYNRENPDQADNTTYAGGPDNIGRSEVGPYGRQMVIDCPVEISYNKTEYGNIDGSPP